MLTVLNVSQRYRVYGGSDRYFFALAKILQEHSHSVIPFTAGHPNNLPTPWSDYFPEGVNFEAPSFRDILRFVYSKSAANAMRKILKHSPIDIAHLHIYYGQLTASILASLQEADLPIVQTLHEYKIVCPVYTLVSNGEICQACQGHAFWHAIVKRCNRGSLARSLLSAVESYVSKAAGSIRKIDHFITVSNFQRDKVIELGLPAEKVTTIPNFIDTNDIQPNCEPGDYFLYFGRLEKVKGLFTLIEAASSLKDIPLLIAGDGEIRLELEQLIEQKELKHVHLLGFKAGNELQQLIRNSICTLVPSQWYETFGLTLIESFAHGRPVIASSIGGICEIVSDTIDGFLVPPKNVEILREKMLWMAEHRHEAVEMGQAGRKKVETQFNPEIHYEKIMEVYRKVL
jgi:glycosyltransferase involved in cell wall biosynthesis